MRKNIPKPSRWTTGAGLAAALGLCLLSAGCRGDGRQTVVKLAHGLDPSHPVHRAMELMARRVDELSGGSMRLDIYPSEQLGSERECLELLQIGSLGMTKVSAAVLESFVTPFRVLTLPYIFRDEAHVRAVLEGPIGRELLLGAESARLRGLAFYDAGSRSFYTCDRPVHSPADLAGLKIRTQESATAVGLVNALGGAATPIAWGELYTALQQGVVDGAENNPPSFYLSHHYEVARFYSLDEHTTVPDVLLVSTVIWNRLEPRQQEWLETAAAESALYQRRIWKEATDEALRAVAEAGVEILRPDKAPFAEKVAPMLDGYRGDPEVFSLVQRIQAAGPTLRPPLNTKAQGER